MCKVDDYVNIADLYYAHCRTSLPLRFSEGTIHQPPSRDDLSRCQIRKAISDIIKTGQEGL
jgi:hypothetical protein